MLYPVYVRLCFQSTKFVSAVILSKFMLTSQNSLSLCVFSCKICVVFVVFIHVKNFRCAYLNSTLRRILQGWRILISVLNGVEQSGLRCGRLSIRKPQCLLYVSRRLEGFKVCLKTPLPVLGNELRFLRRPEHSLVILVISTTFIVRLLCIANFLVRICYAETN